MDIQLECILVIVIVYITHEWTVQQQAWKSVPSPFTASPVGTSPHVLTGYFEKKKVLLYMSQDDTTGTVLYLLRGSVKDQTMWVILMRHLLEKGLLMVSHRMHVRGEDKDLQGISQAQYHWWGLLSAAGAFLTYSQFLTYFAVDSSSVQWLVIPYCDHWDGIHCCLTVYLPFCYWVWKWTIRYLCNEHKNIKLSPAHGYLCMPKASEQHEQKQPNGHSTLCKIKYYLK